MFIPEFLMKLGNDSAANRAWLESLPSIIEKIKEEWKLGIGNPFLENATCSYVAPCVVNEIEQAVLKIGLPHEEALHEIDGLRLLNGNPTVRLLNFDTETNAMLLEQCLPGTQLATVPETIQDEIISRLLSEIWKTNYTGENFRPLANMISQWNKETFEKLERFPDPDLAREGCELKEKLIESTEEPVLLATDLYAGNVLRAERKDWLVIDVKPYIGDRTYDLTQHLLNCIERLTENPDAAINRVAKLAGVSSSRLSDWIFARLASENGGVHQKLASKLR
ncbi:MAG: aminoglycoside phosphotransferase family protein [Aridibacter sp.]